MCERLHELVSSVTRFTRHFDEEVLTLNEARRAMTQAAKIEAAAKTMKALAAARVSASSNWREAGHRSCEDAVASETGTSVSAARQLLGLAKSLEEHAGLKAAALSGELSFEQVSLVAEAVSDDPRSAARLMQLARDSSHAQLKDEVARTKAAAVPDPEEKRRRIHSRRCLRSWSDLEGVWHLKAMANPEDGARIMAAISPLQEGIFKAARSEGRREPPEAYALDALVELAERSSAATCDLLPVASPPPAGADRTSSAPAGTDRASSPPGGAGRAPSPRAGADRARSSNAGSPRHDAAEATRRPTRSSTALKILVRIDYEAFVRGMPLEGETCEIAGFGPVAVSAVRELIENGDPFVAAIMTRAKAIVGVAHLGRKPTSHQRSALDWLFPTCAAEGCMARAHLECDHRIDWSKTKITMFDQLDYLCSHHHKLKTRENWALVDGRGKRAFVPPDDSRNPANLSNSGRPTRALDGSRRDDTRPWSTTKARRRSAPAVDSG